MMEAEHDIISKTKSIGTPRTLKQFSISLRKAETVSYILIEAGFSSASIPVTAQTCNKNPRLVATFDAIAPTEYVA